MKTNILTILFLCVSFAVYSQDFVITGHVIDSEDIKQGLPLAQLCVMNTDSTIVAATVSDNSGIFHIKLKKAGKYILRATFIGYKNYTKNVELTAQKHVADIGSIKMKPDIKLLREAQVTGIANELTIKADTFVYHSNAFRVPEGASIAALIKQLPGLSMDSDGNLTFQGKNVASILVNGKPFFGDANTAMSNIVSDAVEDVKVYEKTDEDKEFVGLHDSDKETVVDLKIKKEYMSSWNMNVDAGVGTNDRFIGKLFASNFNDKRRTALYAQANNLSQNQQVDENGNWRFWNNILGLYTYRKAGTIMGWSNGLKNTEKGYFDSKCEVNFGHDNSNNSQWDNAQILLGDGNSIYSYNYNSRNHRYLTFTVLSSLTWNIDTLNRFTMSLRYRSSKSRRTDNTTVSSYNAECNDSEPFNGLIGSDIDHENLYKGVNSQIALLSYSDKYDNINVRTSFLHRFVNTGGALNVNLIFYGSKTAAHNDELSHYRYFGSNLQQTELLRRKYNSYPNDKIDFTVGVGYQQPIGKHLNYSVDYSFCYERSDYNNALYLLDEYDYYRSLNLPLGVRPSSADSLRAVIDTENSYEQERISKTNKLRQVLSGEWEKLEFSTALSLCYTNEELLFKKATGICYNPGRNYYSFSTDVSLKWKFVKNGELRFFYNNWQQKPALEEMLPLTDSSDDMYIIQGNPGLRTQFEHRFSMYGNYFGDKRGDNYNFSSNITIVENSRRNTLVTDEFTGRQFVSYRNVNGCYSAYCGLGTGQPLDSARHWQLNARVSMRVLRDKSYIGKSGDATGVSVVHNYSPHANASLSWRKDMWSLNFSCGYTGEFSRYALDSEYDQSGHIYEWSFQPQVDLPFGTKINSSFGLYKRVGYDDVLLNHNQWLWNITVSQSLLKNKALTLQLEMVDILKQRTSEYSSISGGMRNFTRVETFLSYVMLHAVYRLNISGK